MARPSKGYKVESGELVPGVTTIISKFDDKSGLIQWANSIGLQGMKVSTVRKLAFAEGTEVHDVFENIVLRRKFKVKLEHEEFVEAVKKLLNDLGVKEVISEKQMLSEKHRFGGTPDVIAETPDEAVPIDLKFANFVSLSVAIQLGAYKLLYEENGGKKPIKRGLVFHLEKKNFKSGKTVLTVIEILDLGFFSEIFLKERELYDLIEEGTNRFGAFRKQA